MDKNEIRRWHLIQREIAAAARLVGSFSFYERLLDALTHAVDADAGQIMYYSPNLVPQYLRVFNTPKRDQLLYQQGYYRLDPFYRYWHDSGKGGVARLHDITRKWGKSSDYFHNFWPTTSMVDELVIFLPIFKPAAICLFVQKKRMLTPREQSRVDLIAILLEGLNEVQIRLALTGAAGTPAITESQVPLAVIDAGRRIVWRSQEMDRLEMSYSLVDELVRSLSETSKIAAFKVPGGVVSVSPLDADFWMAPGGQICLFERGEPAVAPIDYSDAVGGFVPDGFTAREKEIVGLILLGHPTTGISDKLGITVGTVRNHRKRIYRKLDITTERELFLGFLAYITGARR